MFMNLESSTFDVSTIHYFDASELTEDRLECSPAEIEMLETINRKVAARESLENLLSFLLEHTAHVSPCDRMGLAFFEEEGRRAVAGAVTARYSPLVLRSGYTQNMAGSSLEPILQNGVVRIIDDLEAYGKNHPESVSTQLLVREGVRSNMTCPLRVEGRIVGVLFRSSRQACAYNRRQAALHIRIAERLSQAVEKVRQIEQLRAVNEAYLEMLGFVSHELKNPLAALITSGNLLIQGYVGELTPRQKEWATRMTTKAEYLLGLIRNYLDLARLEGGQMTPTIRDGLHPNDDIIRPALELLNEEITQNNMQVIVQIPDDIGTLSGDPDLLKIVAVNLIGNAITYGRKGGELRLTVRRNAEWIDLIFWNNGSGFTADDQNRLFKKFSRLQHPELAGKKGTGLGLYTSWRIVHLHKGHITARSEPNQWAEFTVRLPGGEKSDRQTANQQPNSKLGT